MAAITTGAVQRLGVAVALLLLASATRAVASDVRDFGPAPAFALASVTGERTALKDALERGPVILDFWATWCAPCRQALPALQQLHERYAARGLTVLAVSTDEPRNQPKIGGVARALGLTFPILIDTDKRASQLYRVEAIPMTFLIDRDGRIRSLHRGYREGDAAQLERELLPLLGPQAGADE